MTSADGRRNAMYTPPSTIDPLERATGYPYLIPDSAYLFENGQWRPLEAWSSGLTRGRVPVIACGSNRSPQQLGRKYADFDEVSIPVERAWLADFDVVYAAHITGYGSIAANLQHVPGARVEVSITWLAGDLLPRMHATEGRGADYVYARLEELSLETEHGARLSEIFGYVYQHGSLRHDGDHVGLAEIRAEARPHAEMTQREILSTVHARLGGVGSFEDFIHENIGSAERRFERERLLQADAIPFRWDKLTVIED